MRMTSHYSLTDFPASQNPLYRLIWFQKEVLCLTLYPTSEIGEKLNDFHVLLGWDDGLWAVPKSFPSVHALPYATAWSLKRLCFGCLSDARWICTAAGELFPLLPACLYHSINSLSEIPAPSLHTGIPTLLWSCRCGRDCCAGGDPRAFAWEEIPALLREK